MLCPSMHNICKYLFFPVISYREPTECTEFSVILVLRCWEIMISVKLLVFYIKLFTVKIIISDIWKSGFNQVQPRFSEDVCSVYPHDVEQNIVAIILSQRWSISVDFWPKYGQKSDMKSFIYIIFTSYKIWK